MLFVEGRVGKAVALLTKAEVFSPDDLVGTAVAVVEKAAETAISAGLHGFIARAIERADELSAEAKSKPEVQPAGDLGRPIKAMEGGKREEPKLVHADIGEAVSKLKVQGLGQQFWPKSAAMVLGHGGVSP